MRLAVLTRVLAKVSRIGSAFPLLWLFGVFVFYIRSRYFLGHWPTYSNPDPKWLPFEFHHAFFMLAVFPVLWSLFVLPVIWIFRGLMQCKLLSKVAGGTLSIRMHRLVLASKEVQKEVTLYLFGWALIWATFFLPHRGFVDWFLD